MNEIEKYAGIYKDRFATYGHSNHGRDALPLLLDFGAASVLDVGCGHNEFVKGIRKDNKAKPLKLDALGVDFACPTADLRASATSLPFFDERFDVVTSFDCLEHLLPTEVDAALAEFRRVSRAFIFSISYAPSRHLWKGQNLHPTVRPQEWWVNRIREAGGVEIKLEGRYILGRWSGRALPSRYPVPFIGGCPVTAGQKCLLVGNGPSIMDQELGAQIDAFDSVIRFNRFHTVGFEKHTGERTDLWVTFGGGTLPASQTPKRVLMRGGGMPPYVPEALYRIPRAYFHEKKKELQQLSQLDETAKSRIIPSTGLVTALWLLESLPEIYLVGFDSFQKDERKLHHYWSKGAYGNPKEHDGTAELTMIRNLRDAGRISIL